MNDERDKSLTENGPAETARQDDRARQPELPDDLLILAPMRSPVLFPGALAPVALGRSMSVAAAQRAVKESRPVGFLLQRDKSVDEPGPDDLYRVGSVASILRYVTTPDGTHHLICNGERRFRVLEFVDDGYPFLAARVEYPEDTIRDQQEVDARVRVLRQQAERAIELLPELPRELAGALESVESGGALADLVAGFLDLPAADKQKLLETFDVEIRLDIIVREMAQQLEVIELSKEIESKTMASIDERQREAVLREQLRTIQQQLGEDEEDTAQFEAIEKAIEESGMPEEAAAQARKELARLKRTPAASPDHSITRTYLEWLTELPWQKVDSESIDVEKARRILDEDHYALDKVKKRIIEYLAVRKLNPEGKSPILCFVGPPGVGKTSLGRSIARAIGLEFARFSLGGVHDEAEIRGHRRTYIGALPGKVIQAISKAGTRNPVMMLDEIDKLGAGIQGDPASALLEVLDPEQNSTFQDNYLGLPFDLSKVLFIATANRLDTIPAPLLDRMEVIELSGYTVEEKLEIAKRYLVDRQLEANGINPEQAEIADDALELVITDYTREAGCRNLEKHIGALMRSVAVEVAEGKSEKTDIGKDDVVRVLGAPRYENEVALRTSVPGVATGLAWTPVGGDILFIEATIAPGTGKLILTGQLGDVMKESAQAALSLLKNRADVLDVDHEHLGKSDIHVHVPAGAIPKDGPSAGVAMFVALASMLAERPVHADVAMTGEISLRGLVLPVGGIKEKVIAAHRAGIGKVLLPARNKKDYDDIPESVRGDLEFVWLATVDDALKVAFDGEVVPEEPASATG